MRRRRLGWAFAALTACTWALLVFGASVRVHGAGLACPDWPMCFGEVVPPLDFGVALEWGHRLLAGLITLGFAGGVVFALRDRETRAAVGVLPWVAAGLLALQIVLGGLTVLKLLAPWTVSWHLLVGNAFLATVFLHALRLLSPGSHAPLQGEAEHGSPSPRVSLVLAGLLAALLFVQFRLGGLVSASGATLACPDWPTCREGVWFPAFTGPVGLHVLHRLVGYALIAHLGVFAWATRKSQLLPRAALGLALTQAVVGIANVLLQRPVEVTLLHTALAGGLVLVTTAIAWDAVERAQRGFSALSEVTPSLALEAK